MTTARTAFRIAAALGATTALTLAGAGAASATTADSTTDGNTVSVFFELEEETTDTCGAALIPAQAGLGLIQGLNPDGAGVGNLLEAADNLDGVQVLQNDSALTVSLSADSPTGTVTATDVPSGAYGLVTVCLSEISDPGFEIVTVGSPLDIISGLSSGGGLNALSSMVGGAEGEGTIGLDTLSAGLGGGDLVGDEQN